MVYLNQNPAADLDAAMTHFFGSGYTTASFVTEVQTSGLNFVNNQMNLTNSDTGAVSGLDADGGAIRTAGNVLTDYGTTYGDNVLQGFNETFEKISNADDRNARSAVPCRSGIRPDDQHRYWCGEQPGLGRQ